MVTAFQDWVQAFGGFKKAAASLKVSVHSVRYWHARKGSPRVGTIIRLITLSKGRLSAESIIASTQPAKRRKGAK